VDFPILDGYNAAKACFQYSMALKNAAQEREDKRMKALREAEALVLKEQEKIAQASQRSSSQAFPQ
jgi:tyrosine-protein phosphatase YwqE